jgi:hypothetical protein
MENIEGQKPDGTNDGRLVRLDRSARGFGKHDFDGSVKGMEKAKAGHGPTREGILEGLGRMLPMDEAGIAQEMNVNEREQDDQAKPSADLFPRPTSHGQMYSAITGALRQSRFVILCAAAT